MDYYIGPIDDEEEELVQSLQHLDSCVNIIGPDDVSLSHVSVSR